MLILIGKTASGKDTIANELVKCNFKKIVTYTTRPMRTNEKQDITYHFISEKEFKQKIQEGFFAEWKTYDTEQGAWYYGTSLEDLNNADDKSIIILTPDGYREISKKICNKSKCIYIYANNNTIEKRLLKRGDNKEEAKRRLEHDSIDFKNVEYEVNRIVYNNYDTNINDVINKILEFMEEK